MSPPDRAGRTRRHRRGPGCLAAEPGGAARRGLHGAVVVQLVLVLGDRADHDRGVGQLPGEGVAGVEVEDVGDDAGDVVGAAAAQRELDQLLHGLLRALVAGEGLLERLVGHDAGQPVGADQIAVAGPDLADGEVGLDVVAAAQRPHQQRALRVGGGLLLGDAALVDQALHPGVVLGDLRERRRRAAGTRASRRRGTRPRRWPVHSSAVSVVPMPSSWGSSSTIERSWSLARWTAVPSEVRMSEPGTSSSSGDDGGDHLGGGDLTGGLAAHAVGDGEQARTGVAGVLVALPDHALVRSGGEAQ